MIVPMIDQALAQARMLIGVEGGVKPPERAKYSDEKGRTFTRVPAREWRRLLNEALSRVGLVLVTESETLTGGDLNVTFSLTHVGCGDTRTLTRAEPLPPAKSRSMGKQWAHTRAVNAIARTLLWQWDDEDEAADDAEDDAEKVQREDRAPRPRGQRPTRATRATNTLAGVLTGQVGEPAIELGQAEQEQEEQRAAEAEKAAEERAAAQPSAPVADPDWLKERADVPPLEDRLRVELERTRDQIQTREAAEDGTASPAPGSLLGAAHTDDPPMAAKPEQVESSTPAETVSSGAPSNTDAPPAPGPVPPGEAGEVSSPAPERTSDLAPGQGASSVSLTPSTLSHGGPVRLAGCEAIGCGQHATPEEHNAAADAYEAETPDEDEDEDEGWCGRVGPPHATCTTCGRRKAPLGRSVSPETPMCDDDCPGYREEPKPDTLWPGERCAPPLCWHGEEAPDLPDDDWGEVEERPQLGRPVTAPARAPVPPAAAVETEEDRRRERAARWMLCKVRTAKDCRGPCAECGNDVEGGDSYREGLPAPAEGQVVKRRSKKPTGIAHTACVEDLAQGRDPRAEEAATA